MINGLSKEEVEMLYEEILAKLASPFPDNTVEFKDVAKKRGAYIPTHPIMYRLRTAGGPYWSWRLTTDHPIYHEASDEIEVRGVLTILSASAEGRGFFQLQRDEKKRIQFYREAIRSASSDALRDAADFFGIGHKDLAPYREWAKNPGAGLLARLEDGDTDIVSDTSNITVEKCLKCGVVLSDEDKQYLQLVKWTNLVCKEHVPVHQKRKYDPDYMR